MILFKFKVNNVVDVITNSSSELFVLKGETKSIVEEMISNVYPSYRYEYNDVKHISELSISELNQYIEFHCNPSVWPATKSSYPILDGFTFEELYEPKKNRRTGIQEPPAWNGEIQYELKNNDLSDNILCNSFVTKENHKKIIDKLDPGKEMYFLFSIGENPDWDYQEKLMTIGDRFHLG